MSQAVADTHAVVWYLLNPSRLSQPASDAFTAAAQSGDPVWVASISLVELVYLTERKRLPPEALVRLRKGVDDPTTVLRLVSLDARVADAIPKVPRDVVPDMPDRIITATAIALNLPLITADGRIRRLPISTIW